MPHEVLNPALYHDRTVQDWHRVTFGKEDDAIDLDLIGVCHRCRAWLYMIEASTNPRKPTNILRWGAQRLGIPGFLILHSGGIVTGGRRIDCSPHLDVINVATTLRTIRADHTCHG